jgi:prolipoprotein diacylglyceryltransferase
MFPAETTGRYWIWSVAIVPLCSLFVSKIYHYFILGSDFLRNPKKHLAETAFYNQGGQFGILIGTILIAITSKISFFACMDIILTASCIAAAFGRIGCYSYGCCHGRPTAGRFNTVYTHPDSKVLRIFPELSNVPLVPTQLLSAAFNFFLFGTMAWILASEPKSGVASAFCIIAYNLFRVYIEKYRISVVNISERTENMKLFQRVASILSLSGIVYLLAVLWFPSNHLTFVAPLTLSEFLTGHVFRSQAILALSVTFLIYIVTWGIHYNKLGQHFEWK